MLVSDRPSWKQSQAPPANTAAPAHNLPAAAVIHLVQMRTALARYRSTGTTSALAEALAKAGALLAELQATAGEAGARPELTELRRLSRAVPELGELLSAAAGEADRAIGAGTDQLWQGLGLRSAAPRWTTAELETARMVFACLCAPAASPANAGDRLQTGLRQLAAPRFAELLCAELEASEEAWTRALGERYASVRHRCAPRTAWRSRGLSDMLRADPAARQAVSVRLARWMADGGTPGTLAAELEAAIVHARTPARFA